MHLSVRTIIETLWGGWSIVWLVGALTAKRAARTQSAGSRLLHMSLAALAIAVGYSSYLAVPPLTWPFVPASPATEYAGVFLAAAGIGLAIWARVLLGGNWSSSVTVKENHSLVRRGPYALVRHPIYSGILLALLGSAIAFREVRALVAVGLFWVMFSMKSRIEERFMIEEFGEEYKSYCRKARALIPFVY